MIFYTKNKRKILYIFFLKLYKRLCTLNLKPMKKKETDKKGPAVPPKNNQHDKIARDRQGTRTYPQPRNGRY